jgi:hypothetical protein
MSKEHFSRHDGRAAPAGVLRGPGRGFAGPFSEVAWNSLAQPGAYVERETGNLYRIPAEALIRGSSPVIRRESRGGARFVHISRDPYITTVEARMLAASRNVSPNF